jgi:protein SCO1
VKGPLGTLLLGAVLVVVLAGCGGSKKATISHPPATARTGGVAITGDPVAPPFTLRDDRGTTVRLSDFRGKWVAVAFLYTHCPDVCPLIAQNLNAALRQAPDLRVVAVSVDPKGDTPAAVRAFVENHHLTPSFHYLIGSRAQLRPVWRSWHVATVPGPSDTVSHSSFEVLVDPKGRERFFYDAQVRAADVLHDLRQLHATV